jgi:hypothetical protein
MFCARANRSEDPAKPKVEERSAEEVREEAIEDLIEAIVAHENEHYSPDERGILNGRCSECSGRTEPVRFTVMGEENVVDMTVYCPVCEPGLKGHPAKDHVYV